MNGTKWHHQEKHDICSYYHQSLGRSLILESHLIFWSYHEQPQSTNENILQRWDSFRILHTGCNLKYVMHLENGHFIALQSKISSVA